ncbi:MAG: preprotein translocase subunit YajC [Fusobacteriaceae bacterium]|jgi:preprotein translocase subunit YajC|nr:preprotein translocase subunit YajC [Fusobacteriaceae bacterium]
MQSFFSNIGGRSMLIPLWVGLIAYMIWSSKNKKKKDKIKEQEKEDSLKEGREIVTIGGIYGKIVSVDAIYAHIKVDQGVKIKILKSAISKIIDEK